MTACPAVTSREPFLCSTRSVPLRTMVNSSKAGVWPGSSHPLGLRMCAMLVDVVWELTRPMYSSMSLGLLPADWMRVGCEISVGMGILFPVSVSGVACFCAAMDCFNLSAKSVTRRRVSRELSAGQSDSPRLFMDTDRVWAGFPEYRECGWAECRASRRRLACREYRTPVCPEFQGYNRFRCR